jgi:UDP-GlcNAc:undecaprenyl-phosphate GlcNAc-1-phosphate transferase
MRGNKEREIRWSDQVKPSLGGIVFFMNFLLAVIYYFFFHGNDLLNLRWQTAFLFAGASLAFLMGLTDDAFNTNPTLKLSAQIACGTLLVFSGLHFHFYSFPFLNYIATVFFVVLIMNAMNLLDNMDGISGGLSLVISMGLLVYQYVFYQPMYMLGYILLCNVCTLFVFLFYNLHPSKIFMGDSGSQFQGYILSAAVIILFSSWTSTFYLPPSCTQIFMIFLLFLLPVTDITTVFFLRLLRGQSPFVGGKDHTNHSLFFQGLSENKIFLLYVILQLVACIFSLLFIFFYNKLWLWLLASFFAISVMSVLFYFSYIVHVKQRYGQKS